jgi:5-methylthioribose kinase
MPMPLDTPTGYRALDTKTLRPYLASQPSLAVRLGGAAADWTIREVSDGYMNLVFAAEGPSGALCVKQALPHVRAATWWPVDVERAFFEHEFLKTVAAHVGALVPAVHHYDPQLFLIAMEWLSPHIILRRELIAGRRYPKAATDVAEYVARATFFTSDLYLPFERKNDRVALFGRNHSALRISTDLIFTDPYRTMDRNRWTTPQLDDVAARFRADGPLKVATQRFALKFLSNTQALIHSDLHSGSVMVTADNTRIIDPEFGVYGPIGLDLGAFVGNLLISYFSQPGHANADDDRRSYQEWLLAQIHLFWTHFRARFLDLWRANGNGDVLNSALFSDSASAAVLEAERQRYMDQLFHDMVGFAAVKMIRRIFSFAHVADFDSIADPDIRSACEAGALSLAHNILTHPERYTSTGALLDAAGRFVRQPLAAGGRHQI